MKHEKAAVKQAIILCAGYGRRMAPLTDKMPKPLVSVAGRPILDYILDGLRKEGIEKIVMNTHYHAHQIKDYVSGITDLKAPEIIISHEENLLNTGGGILKALTYLDDDTVFVLSGDSIWHDNYGITLLKKMESVWDPQKMDCLIALQKTDRVRVGKAAGDYHIDENGKCIRSPDKTGDCMFTGIRILHRRLFAECIPEQPFSFLDLMDKAEGGGRLHGIINNAGDWYHLSTPGDICTLSNLMLGRVPA